MLNVRRFLYIFITCLISAYGAYFAYRSFLEGTVFNVVAGVLICVVGLVGLYGTFFSKPRDQA